SPCCHQEICAKPWLRMPVIHSSWMGRADWFRRNPYRPDATRVEDWELLHRTHSNCRLANLHDVLMGVREDTLSVRQQMTARKELCKYAAESSWRNKDFQVARTMLAQLPRAAVDLVAILAGLGLSILPRSATPATPAEIAGWNSVWETLKPSVRYKL